MRIEQGGERPTVLSTQLVTQLVLRNGVFDQDSMNQHQAVLQQLEAEGRDLLLLATIGGKEPLAAIADEVVGFIPAFDHMQAFLDFMPQLEGRQVLTEIDRLLYLAQLGQGFIRGMRHIVRIEPLENGLWGGGAQLEGDRVFHHLVILLGNEVPTNRSTEDAVNMAE